MTDKPIKWGDAQQYDAEPHSNYQGEQRGVMPTVNLLWMTPDPLGAVAAMSAIYSGKVVRDLRDVTTEMRQKAFGDVQRAHLKAPLEAVKLHFLVEGVDRSFTHQQVRQRTAVFAQESMRFAVLGSLDEATTLPPSLAGTSHFETIQDEGPIVLDTIEQRWRNGWDGAVRSADASYKLLVESGMPAEEARGLLPHSTATRLHYVTDLMNLSHQAGNRLCTQAQFHWRLVFSLMMDAIAKFPHQGCEACGGTGQVWDGIAGDDCPDCCDENTWQFRAIAESGLFRPVCYQLGYCPWLASFDRACTIRQRVELLGKGGVPSSEWDQDHVVPGHLVSFVDGKGTFTAEEVPGINFREWLLNPHAARV